MKNLNDSYDRINYFLGLIKHLLSVVLETECIKERCPDSKLR